MGEGLRRTDMLNGNLFSGILMFAIPLAASSILQQLFNSVDVAVVGHFAQNRAVATAAVGSNGSVINLIINLFVGISVGANVVISNYIGRGERKKANSCVHTAMTIAIISGVFLLFLGLFIARPLLELMSTPEDVLPYAVQYLHIYFLGMPFIMVYNFGSAILRCIGDTRRPLYCLIISGMLNAALNLFLVMAFHMDVTGVAIATVISNIVSASLVCAFLLREKSEIAFSIRKMGIRRDDLVRMLRIGVPAGLQSMLFSISNVFIQSVLNRFGTSVVAGSAVTLNFENFSYYIISAFSQACVTFTSQNIGASRVNRCKKIFRLSMLMSVILSLIMNYTFFLSRGFFIYLFTSDETVAYYAAIRMLYILTPYFLINTYEISGAALRGMGYSLTPAMMSVFGTCIFRLIWAYTIPKLNQSLGALYIVYPISWIITGILVLSSYIIIRRKVFSKIEKGRD